VKEKVFIYSIFRNSEKNLQNYYNQLKNTIEELNNDYEFFLSIYENDSIDNTKKILSSFDFSFVNDFSLILENIGTSSFKSVADEQRVKNLSAARLKALSAKDFLQKCHYVLCIESDVSYSKDCIKNLLSFKKDNNLENVDIVSSVSIHKNTGLYDTWATRRHADEEWGNLYENWGQKSYDRYYSTFNCICLYNADVIKKGATYGWYNERFKKFDCDTAVICENFHKLGHHDIFINYKSICKHIKNKEQIK
jgi:hypothetical protein